VIYGLLTILGRILALVPVFVPMLLARVVGRLVFHGLRSRRRTVLANLHHAFPERDIRWLRRIGLESCTRTVETGLFVLASPYFSNRRIRRLFKVHESLGSGPARADITNEPGIILAPHFSLMEALTLIRAIYADMPPGLEVGALYRPFDNTSLEHWVKATRERHGMRLLSRKDGFGEASAILRKNGRIVVLFDQHAGGPGALSLFMGRLASSSELAGLLAEKHGAKTYAIYSERTGFWHGIVKSELVVPAPTHAGPQGTNHAHTVTIAANIWLEKKMRADDNFCADWLWLHKRWKIGINASERFMLKPKRRDILGENIAALGLGACPRNEHFWIRLPEKTSSTLHALPVIRALRESRPDAALTLLAPASITPLLEAFGIAEKVIPLPVKTFARWRLAWKLRHAFPDTHILLPESASARFEAWLSGAPQRFGIARSRLAPSRFLLSHPWQPPCAQDATRLHQAREWECWWQSAHKLASAADFSSLRLAGVSGSTRIVAILCGGFPDAWPVEHWRTLITTLHSRHKLVFRLLGTSHDKACADAIADALPREYIQNWVGQLDSLAWARALAESACAIGCDTGGLHLANLLSIPIVALYGQKNPLRNGPVFESAKVLLQPDPCRQTGGTVASLISPEKAVLACEVFL
jgi:lauroyl/myristoyl acyltransferase/ADP-heptose:LPS heptosyltransferase